MRRVFLLAALCMSSCGLAADISFSLPSGVKIEIKEKEFLRENFRINGCVKDGEICLINKERPYGIRNVLPKTFIASLVATYEDKKYELDASNMYDAWGRRPLEHAGYIRYFGGGCDGDGSCAFRGIFSDGAASFVAEWVVINGLSYRSVLTDSADVIQLFKKNIDPINYK